MIVDSSPACPCWSGLKYKECCQPFHDGELPQNALQLMRSRYSAYALGLAHYIIHTTHPSHPAFQQDMSKWISEINGFSQQTRFEQLEIIDFTEDGRIAFVTFVAHLKRGDKDNTFTEKSRFEKIGEKWYYVDGKIIPGKASKKQLEGL